MAAAAVNEVGRGLFSDDCMRWLVETIWIRRERRRMCGWCRWGTGR